jgi:hypothetical protein
MRGAERPGKVKWTRPFLPLLVPLPPPASRQTFIDIADFPTSEEESDFNELLELTGHLPLAVSLMANIASFEGYTNTLSRWKIETTTLLSTGYDKTSNLEKSINMSLTSPRLASTHARAMLSLLALLPDGVLEHDLLSAEIPIPSILDCKSLLLHTALVYIDYDGRLKSLSPIRQYMSIVYPPPMSQVEALRKSLVKMLDLWTGHSPREMLQLRSNTANIESVINYSLQREGLTADLADKIMSLNRFSLVSLKGVSPLMVHFTNLKDFFGDEPLHWTYLVYRLDGPGSAISSAEANEIIRRGIKFFTEEFVHHPRQGNPTSPLK